MPIIPGIHNGESVLLDRSNNASFPFLYFDGS